MSQANQQSRQKKCELAASSIEDLTVLVTDINDSKTLSQKKKEQAEQILYLDRI
jgi:hypothetical protein